MFAHALEAVKPRLVAFVPSRSDRKRWLPALLSATAGDAMRHISPRFVSGNGGKRFGRTLSAWASLDLAERSRWIRVPGLRTPDFGLRAAFIK